MWYVWTQVSGGGDAPVTRIFARTNPPGPSCWTGSGYMRPVYTQFPTKHEAVNQALDLARYAALNGESTQVNIQKGDV